MSDSESSSSELCYESGDTSSFHEILITDLYDNDPEYTETELNANKAAVPAADSVFK